MENKDKIKSFTDLIAWQKAHQLVLKVYKIVSNFPKEEIYGLSKKSSYLSFIKFSRRIFKKNR
jgi:Txe/YoeB family toxin of Txe-Axe toxin-antitoxin module